MITDCVIGGSWFVTKIVFTVPSSGRMLNAMVFMPGVPLDWKMALLSEPAPPSRVLVTVNVAAWLVAHRNAEINSASEPFCEQIVFMVRFGLHDLSQRSPV